MTGWAGWAGWTGGALNGSYVRPVLTVAQILLQHAMMLDVVCDFHGDVGVVQCLREPADVNVSALGAVTRAAAALTLALELRVVLDVTRISTVSLLTSGTRRPRRSDDGTTNVVTGQIVLNFRADALPREVSTVGNCTGVTAWWTLWSLWTWGTRKALSTSETRTLQVALNILQTVATIRSSGPEHCGSGDSRWPLRTRSARLPWETWRTRRTFLYRRTDPCTEVWISHQCRIVNRSGSKTSASSTSRPRRSRKTTWPSWTPCNPSVIHDVEDILGYLLY